MNGDAEPVNPADSRTFEERMITADLFLPDYKPPGRISQPSLDRLCSPPPQDSTPLHNLPPEIHLQILKQTALLCASSLRNLVRASPPCARVYLENKQQLARTAAEGYVGALLRCALVLARVEELRDAVLASPEAGAAWRVSLRVERGEQASPEVEAIEARLEEALDCRTALQDVSPRSYHRAVALHRRVVCCYCVFMLRASLHGDGGSEAEGVRLHLGEFVKDLDGNVDRFRARLSASAPGDGDADPGRGYGHLLETAYLYEQYGRQPSTHVSRIAHFYFLLTCFVLQRLWRAVVERTDETRYHYPIRRDRVDAVAVDMYESVGAPIPEHPYGTLPFRYMLDRDIIAARDLSLIDYRMAGALKWASMVMDLYELDVLYEYCAEPELLKRLDIAKRSMPPEAEACLERHWEALENGRFRHVKKRCPLKYQLQQEGR